LNNSLDRNPNLFSPNPRMSQERLIVIGRVMKPFGIKGEILIAPFTESFEAFEKSEALVFGDVPVRVLSMRIHKGNVLATIEGCQSPEKAGEFRGSLVKTNAGNLPPKEEDEYYWFELIGLKVSTVDGRDLGSVTAITPTGANDVLHVEGAYGEILLPMIDDVVLDINIEAGAILVDPLEVLIPDA
jgi:16S rRNA processing protein RimM